MRVDWYSAAVAAKARSAVGRTTVALGTHDAMGNGLDDGTGKEAEGFLTMFLPKLGGKEVRGSKRSQERDFTLERRSAHVLSFRPSPVTSRVEQWTGMHLTMVLPDLGGRGVRRSKRSQGSYLPPSASARTSWAFADPR